MSAPSPFGEASSRVGGAAARLVALSGPWPAGRTVRAVLALGLGVLLATLPAGVDPRVAPLLALPAFAGVGLLAVVLARGHTAWLGPAVALIGVPAAIVVADSTVASTAGVGTALVAVFELSRWSVERRVDLPGPWAGESRRWLHLAVVLGGGWLAGVGVVAVASGRVHLAPWHALLGALAAVTVAAVTTLLARSDR